MQPGKRPAMTHRIDHERFGASLRQVGRDVWLVGSLSATMCRPRFELAIPGAGQPVADDIGRFQCVSPLTSRYPWVGGGVPIVKSRPATVCPCSRTSPPSATAPASVT